ncbi:hypothetical protein SORBI_3004G216001 [Sorghum bicolor]|uniref:Peptidase S8/S53 domain-containing protein n=1 Tax=Sorghum bicolor TaxID=4558 RepID=A0A1Z5RNI9_SORBI|nr:hypothetical protein SORBI_3004G216001 [Sorghum bicolor]
MYKVSGMMMAVAAAIDAAVKDGVDIILLSLSDNNLTQFFNNSLAIRALSVEHNGVFVVLMRGNSGPNASMVLNSDGHDGHAGIVFIDTDGWSQENGGDSLVLVDTSSPPKLVLSLSAGEQLKHYIALSAYPVASFSFPCTTVIAENRAPMVATFSSWVSNPIAPQLLKPDLIAPGQDVLAAWKGGSYMMASKTSMSCPHVASVATLMRKKHTGWTLAMMRSALVTIAATLDNTGWNILDNYMHVFMTNPGLATCTRPPLPDGPADLNYSSFVVVFGGHGGILTLTRMVLKHVEVTITPMVLEFKECMETKTYMVDFRAKARRDREAAWDLGHIVWESKKQQMRSAVAFHFVDGP